MAKVHHWLLRMGARGCTSWAPPLANDLSLGSNCPGHAQIYFRFTDSLTDPAWTPTQCWGTGATPSAARRSSHSAQTNMQRSARTTFPQVQQRSSGSYRKQWLVFAGCAWCQCWWHCSSRCQCQWHWLCGYSRCSQPPWLVTVLPAASLCRPSCLSEGAE